MHIIAVANQKGGVGKTTTSMSVAASLAKGGSRVLLIDMDPQGNLTLGIGVEPEPERTLYELLTAICDPSDLTHPTAHAGLETLKVIPAGPSLARAEGELLGQVGFDEILKHKLRAESDVWEFVVIDCPPSLSALTINAIGAADLVLAPVQCEFFSARGVVKLFEVVQLVRQRRNPRLRFRLVPTLFDKRNNICRAVLAELRSEFGHEVSRVVVGIDTRMREAQARGRPICIDSPRSRSAVAYDALAAELQGVLASEQGGFHAQAA